MENLIIGKGLLKLNILVRIMKESSSYPKLLENWKSFGRDLGVNEATIAALSMRLGVGTIQLHDIPHELLSFWKADEGNKASLKTLCDALARCRLHHITELLEERFWLDAVKSLRIKLHDNLVNLQDILDENTSLETYRRIYNIIKESCFLQPINLLKNDAVPQTEINYYIKRTLSYSNQIDERIFQTVLKEHLLLVKGITKNELAKLSGYQPVDVTGNQFDGITVNLMVLERDEDFNRICDNTKKHVHLIEYQNHCYIWIKSNKGLNTLRPFMKENLCTEDDFKKQIVNVPPPHAVIISDSPGMGKSFFLGNLALEFKRKRNSIILFIILDEFAKHIMQIKIDSPSSAVEAIADFVCPNEVSKLVLEVVLNSKMHTFDLFLDGYDELDQATLAKVNTFLKHVKNQQNFRVFVTTRPHLRHQLENILNVLSHEMLPFNELNQIEFLTKYWVDKHGAEHGKQLESYAKKCLISLHDQISDKEWEIAGIPLQCRVLAEVYAEDSERASKVEIESTRKIKSTSLFDIYNSLVQYKFGRIPDDSKNNFKFMSWIRGNVKMNYINAHVYASIALLFPSWLERFHSYLKGFDQIEENTLYSIGLLEKSQNQKSPRFIHRTFAEYLLAEYLVKNMEMHSECAEMIFGVILGGNGVNIIKWNSYPNMYTLQYSVITYFLNMHFKHQIKPRPINEFLILNRKFKTRTEVENVYKAIAICASHDYEFSFDVSVNLLRHITQSECNTLKFLDYFKEKYFKHLLHSAVQSSTNVTIIKKVLNFMRNEQGVGLSYHIFHPVDDNISSYPWIIGCTPLHLAVHDGKYNIVAYLLQEYGEQIKNIRFLLNMCVRYSSCNTKSMIQDKLSIIEAIVAKAKKYDLDWLEERFNDLTPVLEMDVHLRLLRKLVELGANINADSEYYGTVLHMSGNSSSEEFKELVPWVLSKGFDKINYWNHSGTTVLLKYIKGADTVDAEMLKMFHDAGAYFDLEDNEGNSVLFHALRSNTTSVINKIVHYGANVNRRNRMRQNAAHIILSESSIKDSNSKDVLDKLNLITSRGFKLLNQSDSNGVTPFQLLVKSVTKLDDPKIFEFFHSRGVDFRKALFYTIGKVSYSGTAKIIECGADVNYENNQKQNVAHVAILNAKELSNGSTELINILTLIMSKGFNRMNNVDHLGNTALHYLVGIVRLDLKQLLQFFYKNGADFTIRDNDGWSVIFKALWNNQSLKIIQILLEYGAYLYSPGTKGENALHIASWSRSTNSSVIQFISRKIGINSIDYSGRAPLHYLFMRLPPKEFLLSERKILKLELLKFYYELGADFNAAAKLGDSVLFYAISYCGTLMSSCFSPEINTTVTNLIKKVIKYGGDVNHVNQKMENAAHITIKYWSLSFSSTLINILELFLQNGFEKLDKANAKGLTPLSFMISNGHLNKELLEFFHTNGANYNSVDKRGSSVLFNAIRSNQNAAILSKILEFGADLHYLNSQKANALHVAALCRNNSALEFLIGKLDINSGTSTGTTPLHYLVSKNHPLDLKLLELFYKNGANFNATNSFGSILFRAIASNQDASVISKVFEYGGDPYHLNLKNNNALLIAAGMANSAALEFLLDNFQYDINAVDDDGDTPLHEIFSDKNKDYRGVLKLLLKWGSKFDIKNKNGYTPLVWWIIKGKNPYPTLIEFQHILPITVDIASEALGAMVPQETLPGQQDQINSSEHQENLQRKKDPKYGWNKNNMSDVREEFSHILRLIAQKQ